MHCLNCEFTSVRMEIGASSISVFCECIPESENLQRLTTQAVTQHL